MIESGLSTPPQTGPAAQRLPRTIFENILGQSDSLVALRLIIEDKFWQQVATSSLTRRILHRSGATAAVWRDSASQDLRGHAFDRLDIVTQRSQRSYTLPTGVWDISGISLSPDGQFLVGQSDGMNLYAFDTLLEYCNAFCGDWDVWPMGWSADGRRIIGCTAANRFVTVNPYDDNSQEVRFLPGPMSRPFVKTFEFDATKRYLGAGFADGSGCVVDLATETLVDLPAARSARLSYTLHFVYDSDLVIHSDPGGGLWCTAFSSAKNSLEMPQEFSTGTFGRLIGYPKSAALHKEGGVQVLGFASWPPRSRQVLARSEGIKHWLPLPTPSLWLTVGGPHMSVKLWRFDGLEAQLQWQWRKKREVKRLVRSAGGRFFGLIDTQKVTHLFDATFMPPRPLGKFQLAKEDTEVCFDALETHVLTSTPLQDTWLKRLVAQLP